MKLHGSLLTAAMGAMLLLLPDALPAQVGGSSAGYDTRAELEARLAQLEERLAGMSMEAEARDSVRARLGAVRTRLQEGDFRPGDMVAVRVPGSSDLSGTFPVEEGPFLRIPDIDPIDLAGVLYAEADSVVREELARYVRTDRIRARPLKRVAVVGAVQSPGFYDLAPSTSISDALMQAGGPTQGSNLDKIQVRREGQTVMGEEKGVDESATLATLGVRRGDQIYLPPQSTGGFGLGTFMTVLGAAGTVVFSISRIF